MRLECPPHTKSSEMHLGADGRWVFSGDGTHNALVTGKVVDESGKMIGDFYKIAMKAVKAWERFALDHGLLQTAPEN